MSDDADTTNTIDATMRADPQHDADHPEDVRQQLAAQHERITQIEARLARQPSADRGTSPQDRQSHDSHPDDGASQRLTARPSAQSPRASLASALSAQRAAAAARAALTGHRNDVLMYMRLRRG